MFAGDIALVDDYITDDFVTHVAPLPWKTDVGTTAGPEEMRQWLGGGLRSLMPDMRFSADVGPIPGSSPDAVGRADLHLQLGASPVR